jgi:hypothetical protein
MGCGKKYFTETFGRSLAEVFHEEQANPVRGNKSSMTMNNNKTVSLSASNWLAIIAITVTLLISTGASYLRHDRLLTELTIETSHTRNKLVHLEERLERVENALHKMYEN